MREDGALVPFPSLLSSRRYPICASRASPRCPSWPCWVGCVVHKTTDLSIQAEDWGMCCAPTRLRRDVCTAIRYHVWYDVVSHLSSTLHARRSAQSYRLRANARYQRRRCALLRCCSIVLITEFALRPPNGRFVMASSANRMSETSQSQAQEQSHVAVWACI